MIKKKLTIVVSLISIFISLNAFAQNKTLRIATVGEPPSLDQQVITSDLATMIAQHIFEGLYTFDASYRPVPLLAEKEVIKNNGKQIDIFLRKDVVFQNGNKMTSKDVVASLNRWGEYGSRGKVLFDNIDSLEPLDDYTIRIKFNKVFGPWKNLLAFINGGPAIYPYVVVKDATKEPIPVKDYIGTGPYKMDSWKPNRYLRITKFETYRSPKGKANGYGGERIAYFDNIDFIPVSDPGTRVSGVQAGDYDYAEQIPGDLYSSLKNDSILRVVVSEGAIFGLAFLNSKAGVFKNNNTLRQAVLAAIDMKPALTIAIGDEELWKANSSFMPETSFWYSTGGKNLYNQNSPSKARRLAKKAGYQGEVIKFIVSKNYLHHYDTAAVMVKQLTKAGFKIDLQVYDWATLISKRGDPSQWDIFFTHHGFVPDPILLSLMNDNYPGWWATKKKNKLKNEFINTTNPKKRKKIWDQLQLLIYEEVPVMKSGDIFNYNIASRKLKGINKTALIWPKFWGVTR